MKKLLLISIAALSLLAIASCEKEPEIKWDDVTLNGFYVAGAATGSDQISADCLMAAGLNEVDKSLRAGMFEKYIVLEAGKEFFLLYNDGGNKARYSATLESFTTPEEEAYSDNPAQVLKGKLVIGNDAPAMKVSKTGLYHIVLDINKAGDLGEKYKDGVIVLLDASDFGVRGGMNSWGFTSSDPKPEFKNEGVTFTFKNQELAKNGEFKFSTGNYWKVTLDDAGKVKAETSLGETGNGLGLADNNNIKVDKGGTYDITLNFKLAQGEFNKSFTYSAVCTKESTAPETMYMIGNAFGNWDWASDGVVDMVPVYGAPGYFWCTRYFTAADEFKFCAVKAWNGDFGDNGNNCKVASDGFYTVFVDGNNNKAEIMPAEVYGIGDAWGADAWDFNAPDAVKFVAEGQVLKATVKNNSTAVRLSSKVTPSAPIEGVTTGNGWIDWWKTEFVYFDGKIAYRGAGNDQERVAVEAGKVITIDFNAGTVTVTDGSGPAATIKTADEFLAWAADGTADATLEADITLPASFVPDTLKATFDGNGHKITYDLTVPAGSKYNAGLFSLVDGTVKNLKVAGKINTEVAYAGGVAGNAADNAVFENCESSVAISAPVKVTYRMGGIVGNAAKGITIKDCVNNGEINHTIADLGAGNAAQLGGIIGHFEATATISGCTNNAKVIYSAKGTPRMGGICGYINVLEDASFVDCTNNGEIIMNSNGSGYCYYAGISGYYGTPTNSSHVLYKNCKNTGNITHTNGVSGTNNRSGGIMCHCGGTAVDVTKPLSVEVINCSNSGNITTSGTSAKQHIGGVIGFTETITCIIKCDGCTNTGSITIEGNGTIGSIHGYSCNPASTYTNFISGKNVVLTTGATGRAGLLMGSGYISTAAIPDAELNTAVTGKVQGGKIVKGETTTVANADNYKAMLVEAGFVGSADGVAFTN